MTRFLLTFATREGQTEAIAQRVTERLRAAGHEATLQNAGDKTAVAPAPARFDRLVFGASVHVGRIEKEMLSFVKRHADLIDSLPHDIFLVSLGAAEVDPMVKTDRIAEAQARLDADLPVPFPEAQVFAGALRFSRLNWVERFIMKRIATQGGLITDTTRDYEFTDWDRVDAYADRLAAL
ncbi:flavodoxin domain-containing protein [Aliiroseovarius subalbicans]|uniref:flavodoxin domain-containing protein n=1 Tax=Aliiroseovarius subalbicans TaxID=2925840 RepID=UPI001F59C1C7|nr:flavodoxin domain-containing protein [Aliiroseovarius subalbicans]MCI2398009.1 hypothetical protein [Aliiroseovarius subalbicans]